MLPISPPLSSVNLRCCSSIRWPTGYCCQLLSLRFVFRVLPPKFRLLGSLSKSPWQPFHLLESQTSYLSQPQFAAKKIQFLYNHKSSWAHIRKNICYSSFCLRQSFPGWQSYFSAIIFYLFVYYLIYLYLFCYLFIIYLSMIFYFIH